MNTTAIERCCFGNLSIPKSIELLSSCLAGHNGSWNVSLFIKKSKDRRSLCHHKSPDVRRVLKVCQCVLMSNHGIINNTLVDKPFHVSFKGGVNNAKLSHLAHKRRGKHCPCSMIGHITRQDKNRLDLFCDSPSHLAYKTCKSSQSKGHVINFSSYFCQRIININGRFREKEQIGCNNNPEKPLSSFL